MLQKTEFKIVKYLLSAIFILVATSLTFAKSSEAKKEAELVVFKLNRPVKIVTSDSTELFGKEVENLLENYGCKNIYSGEKPSKTNIFLNQLDSDPYNTAYNVVVDNSSSITISFGNKYSQKRALEKLSGMIVKKQNFFRRLTSKPKLYIEGESDAEMIKHKSKSNIVDLTKNRLSCDQIILKIKQKQFSDHEKLFLKLSSDEKYMVKSQFLNSLNEKEEFAPEGYSFEELNRIYVVAKEYDIELVAFFDFTTSPNNLFKSYFGHELFSTEGVRFSKYMLEEFISSTSIDAICLGDEIENEYLKVRYYTPLVDIVGNSGKKIVVKQ